MSIKWNVVFFEQWPEFFMIVLALLGFIIAITVSNPALNYLIIFLYGMIAGRMVFEKTKKFYFAPITLILVCIFVGYFIGALFRNLSAFWILAIFAVGTYGSYYIHKRGYIKV